MNELKPCPFCGGKADLVTELNGFYAFVRCSNCYAMVQPQALVGVKRTREELEKAAVEDWNRRES